jgi:hypothetical protein
MDKTLRMSISGLLKVIFFINFDYEVVMYIIDNQC